MTIPRPVLVHDRVAVRIQAHDQLSREGIVTQLQGRGIDILERQPVSGEDEVLFLVVADESAIQEIRRLCRGEGEREGERMALSGREVQVLRLLAEGHTTVEVGRRLFLSERTVKNILHEVTGRLQLRNRTHAVAHAIRHGLI